MARPLLRRFREARLIFHIFTCLGASRLCSTKSGRSWTARHAKLFYWDTRRGPQHFGDFVTGKDMENLPLNCDALISSGLPSRRTDALADPNWKAAMHREFKSLEENRVWDLVKPPSGQGIICEMWHFSRKLDDEGNVVKYTARFVARGFTQTPGSDIHDTYSPKAKLSTLRFVLACGVKLGTHFNEMNIKSANLNAPIQEDIYMEQPEGYQKGKQMLCKLKRSLYGLKHTGRN